ncbi:MAG: non-hydrolyzing UDP-N-acetylglucosamine 2-epimerase [Saccharofermentanales bacterium]|jgi:UDP-N-acetylglucosamine 2-epimerase
MKIITVVGARPQFIKAAVVSRILRQYAYEILVHTGQHYDYNMSDVFFEELDIPRPNFNLGIAGGSHGRMTGQMLIALEDVMIQETPDVVLVYGDTNSTLAAALSAAKLKIPIVHVEAGNRLGTLSNPEELNRICTDHISTRLLACTESALEFLRKENLGERSAMVGDPMYDAFLYYGNKAASNSIVDLLGRQFDIPDSYSYLTCHREENTDTIDKLDAILRAADSLDMPIIYPVHPRNKSIVETIMNSGTLRNIVFTPPIGYLMSIQLVKGAKRIITDSGGVQREAFFAKVPCVTVFDYIVWPETMKGNWNQLAKPVVSDIITKLKTTPEDIPDYKPFGDGKSAYKITNELLALGG